MSFSVISGTLSSSVADTGTFQVSYPTGKDAGNFFLAMGHKMIVGSQNENAFPDALFLSFGASTIEVWNRSGSTWNGGDTYRLQVEEQGERYQLNKTLKKLMPNAIQAAPLLINLGAPDTLDADGAVAAVTLSTVGSTETTISVAGALASGGTATFDVPRCVQVQLSSAATCSVRVYGKDVYDQDLMESFALTGATAVSGNKAFKKVTNVRYTSTTVTDPTLNVGTTDRLGLPVFLPSAANVISQMIDGVAVQHGTVQRLPFTGVSAQLLSGGDFATVVVPVAGRVAGVAYVVSTALAATAAEIGTLWLGNGATNTTVGGTAIGSSPAAAVAGFATGAAIGTTIYQSVSAGASASTVAAGAVLYLQAGASWASAGNISGYIDIAPLGADAGTNLPGNFVAGLRAANGATSSNADVRGVYVPGQACDGTRVYQLFAILPDAGYIGTNQPTSVGAGSAGT